jgi:hypothetical protein
MEADMISSQSDPYSILKTLRRLRAASERFRADHAGTTPASHSEEASPFLVATCADSYASHADALHIPLRDLIQKLGALRTSPSHAESGTIASKSAQTQPKTTFRIRAMAHVDGFVVVNRHLAETERYRFEFLNGATFRILDTWTGIATTIWGDPHLEISDSKHDRRASISGSTKSETHITLLMQDGSRITFTARDGGSIERVDIFHGNQRGWGIGSGGLDWAEETGLFQKTVCNDGAAASLALVSGDIMHAGGDGSEWYDSAGRLVWDTATGPTGTDHLASEWNKPYSPEIKLTSLNRLI